MRLCRAVDQVLSVHSESDSEYGDPVFLLTLNGAMHRPRNLLLHLKRKLLSDVVDAK